MTAVRKGDAKLIDSWRRDSDDKLWVDIQDPASIDAGDQVSGGMIAEKIVSTGTCSD